MNSDQIFRRRASTRRAALAVLLGCSLLATGCVSLDDVAKLTKLADSAQQTLPPVVADISGTCQRSSTFIREIPKDERQGFDPPDCAPYQDVADHILKDQNALIAYFDALGKLASNTPPAFDTKIDANIATINALPNLSSNAIAASTAAQKIVKALADLATSGYRQRKLNSLIVSTDGAVQELTSDLKKIIVTDYAGLLANESAVQGIYYDSPLAAAGKAERLSVVLVQRQYDTDKATLESRKKAAVAYGKVMDNLASLHGKLKQAAVKNASLQEIAKEIGPHIADLKDAFSQLQAEGK